MVLVGTDNNLQKALLCSPTTDNFHKTHFVLDPNVMQNKDFNTTGSK